jgi:hypothetical protein
MVPVVVMQLAEEHGEWIGADDRLRPQLPDDLHQLAPEGTVVLQLAVEVAEKISAGHPQDLARVFRLDDPELPESIGVRGRIRRALVARWA